MLAHRLSRVRGHCDLACVLCRSQRPHNVNCTCFLETRSDDFFFLICPRCGGRSGVTKCGKPLMPPNLQGPESAGDVSTVVGGPGPRGSDVCMRRSTDHGATWGPVKVVAPGGRSPAAAWDQIGRRIVLQFTNSSNWANGELTSIDGGASWSPIRWIDAALGSANRSHSQSLPLST